MGAEAGRGRQPPQFRARFRFRDRFRLTEAGWPRPNGRGRLRAAEAVGPRGDDWVRAPTQLGSTLVDNSHSMGSFVAHGLALELVRAVGRALPKIARREKDLARQLRRSTASVVLNLAEGTHSDPGNRQSRYASAAGSAKETQSALIIAESWGYLADRALLELADRVAAITYRLAHGHIHGLGASESGPGARPQPPGLGPSDPDPAPRSRPNGLGHPAPDPEPDSDY